MLCLLLSWPQLWSLIWPSGVHVDYVCINDNPVQTSSVPRYTAVLQRDATCMSNMLHYLMSLQKGHIEMCLHIVHVWQVLVLCMIWPRVTDSPEKAIYFLPCHLCRNCCLHLCFIVHGTQIGQFVMCPVVNHPCRTGGYIMCYVNIMQFCKSSAWDTCLFSVLNVSHKAYWQGGLRRGNLSLHIFLPLFLIS